MLLMFYKSYLNGHVTVHAAVQKFMKMSTLFRFHTNIVSAFKFRIWKDTSRDTLFALIEKFYLQNSCLGDVLFPRNYEGEK